MRAIHSCTTAFAVNTFRNAIPPGGREIVYIVIENATPDSPRVTCRLSLIRVPNSGGHHHDGHTNVRLAVGVLSTTRFQLRGLDRVAVSYYAPRACGDVELQVHTEETGDMRTSTLLVRSGGGALVWLSETADFKLKEADPKHPSPYWVNERVKRKFLILARAFSNKTGKKITVTEGSLEFGGLFDCECPSAAWKPPHRTHDYGGNLDIRINDLSEGEISELTSLARRSGFRVLRETRPPHLHITG